MSSSFFFVQKHVSHTKKQSLDISGRASRPVSYLMVLIFEVAVYTLESLLQEPSRKTQINKNSAVQQLTGHVNLCGLNCCSVPHFQVQGVWQGYVNAKQPAGVVQSSFCES